MHDRKRRRGPLDAGDGGREQNRLVEMLGAIEVAEVELVKEAIGVLVPVGRNSFESVLGSL